MLTTENPNYFRKDLPRYVPQFFVLELLWSESVHSLDFKKTMEDNFPIEKLKDRADN
jgi:hypothetical protein